MTPIRESAELDWEGKHMQTEPIERDPVGWIAIERYEEVKAANVESRRQCSELIQANIRAMAERDELLAAFKAIKRETDESRDFRAAAACAWIANQAIKNTEGGEGGPMNAATFDSAAERLSAAIANAEK